MAMVTVMVAVMVTTMVTMMVMQLDASNVGTNREKAGERDPRAQTVAAIYTNRAL